MRKQFLANFLFAALSLGGASVAHADFIDVSDSGVELPASVRRLKDAVGVLEFHPFSDFKKRILCTATHIGDGLVLTAGHCVLGSYNCSNVKVYFKTQTGPGQWGNRISRCLDVIRVQSDDARYGDLENKEDFVLMRVSNPPQSAIEPDFENSATAAGGKITMLSYPRIGLRDATELPRLKWSGPCVVTNDSYVDATGRPGPSKTFVHSCTAAGGSNGAPLIQLPSGKLVGLHQTQTSLPPLSSLARFQAQHGSQLGKPLAKSRLAELILAARSGLPISPPKEIWIGAFNPDAYPTGIPGPLMFQVARLDAGDAFTKVSFRLRNGIETGLKVIDGESKVRLVQGQMKRADFAKVTLPTPVRIYAFTQDGAQSLSAAIEDISYE